MEEEGFYEDIYFDTDEEDESIGLGLPKNKKMNRKVLSNDELLYDPELDDEDEKWVNKQIEDDNKKEKTDAILTCPMCFITLSYSCQRHEAYSNQYRAMFVHNCHVIKNERYQPKDGKEDEYYQKVVCDQCGVHVGMMDQDEVYHFFNVIPTA
ncbi:hypothetical protein G6F37_005308 [Rhizopus arrhizus]|nr:hypothetical protein G6F38_001314 [Rhizopus arrhizus]KAG1158978.1 hypothetical protein G6F37_005308 [Rhizopus arrhizus]